MDVAESKATEEAWPKKREARVNLASGCLGNPLATPDLAEIYAHIAGTLASRATGFI